MNFKILLKKLFALLGIQIVFMPHRGVDLNQDIKFYLPNVSIDLIFDVGANIGQSVETYKAWFPKAKVHCFEPTKNTFEQLKANTKGGNNIQCHNLALGASNRTGDIVLNKDLSVMNVLAPESEAIGNIDVGTDRQEISVETLDSFCHSNNIAEISYLKIDTEGSDLEVLKGANRMLTKKKISIIEVETGMNPDNTYHVPFECVKSYLESAGYFLFGIYEQVYEWQLNQPQLRRANSVFIAKQV
jgi:FkbM family methyltransferase